MKAKRSIRLQISIPLILLLLSYPLLLRGQPTAAAVRGSRLGVGIPPAIYIAGWVEDGSTTHVPPPAGFLQGALAPTATITVIYTGDWSTEAKTAFEYAIQIWETQISSTFPVVVAATWENLTVKYGNPNILGSAGAYDYAVNFSGGAANTLYPLPLANRLAGRDLNGAEPEIEASFNSNFPGWYYGTDGKLGSSQYDLVSVALHELGHGLGFIGSMTVSGGVGRWGYTGNSGDSWPFIYDLFAVNGSGQSMVYGFQNGSIELGSQLQSGELYFNGQQAMAANGGVMPRLYAPAAWRQGSSFSHLDDKTYPRQNINALMTPILENGEWVHSPGPVALGILGDLGWNSTNPAPTVTPSPRPNIKSRLYLPIIPRVSSGASAYPPPGS